MINSKLITINPQKINFAKNVLAFNLYFAFIVFVNDAAYPQATLGCHHVQKARYAPLIAKPTKTCALVSSHKCSKLISVE